MTRLGHDGERGPQDVEVPVEMDIQHSGPVLLGARAEVGGTADTGDVDHGVERAELVDQPGEEGLDRLCVRDRCVRCPGCSAGIDDHLCRRSLRIVDATRSVHRNTRIQRHDEGADAAQLFGDRGTDADGSAGYDDNPLLSVLRHLPPMSIALSFRFRTLGRRGIQFNFQSGKVTFRPPFGQHVDETQEVTPTATVRAAPGIHRTGITFEVEP